MRRAALFLILFSACSAAPAAASRTQMSIFEDDHLLLFSGPQARDQALDEIRALGTRTVRVVVKWSLLAPSARSKTRPGVSLEDPANYGSWVTLDGLVFAAQARGVRLLFPLTRPRTPC